jgi:hypothetical protein
MSTDASTSLGFGINGHAERHFRAFKDDGQIEATSASSSAIDLTSTSAQESLYCDAEISKLCAMLMISRKAGS